MTSFSHALQQAMARWGDRKALVFYRGEAIESELSFEHLCRHMDRFGACLSDRGIVKGDRIILLLEKSLAAVVIHLAVLRWGAISIPLNPGFKKSELAYLLKDAAPALVVAEAEKTELLQSIDSKINLVQLSSRTPLQHQPLFQAASPPHALPLCASQDPAIVIYTSGTTGEPKGAILTHGNLLHDALKIIEAWQLRKTDRICHALPLFHVHGLCFALHTALLCGAQTHLLDRFDPNFVLKKLCEKDADAACTVFMAVPAMYTKLMDQMENQQADFSHIRLLASGSAPLLAKDFDRIRIVFGREPVEREGMTETGMNFSNPLFGKKKPGSIGKPLPGLAVRIVNPEAGCDVMPGQIGEIWLKGPGISPGYWRKSEATRRAFSEGWFRTGDLGRLDEDGYYYLTDRIKHIIISGGENVSAKEVESVIHQMDQVIEASVVGVPDEKWGEKVAAAVVLHSGSQLNAAEIQAFCKKHLHDWKCPKEIRFTDAIPKNTMGKVVKEAVKRLFMEGGQRRH